MKVIHTLFQSSLLMHCLPLFLFSPLCQSFKALSFSFREYHVTAFCYLIFPSVLLYAESGKAANVEILVATISHYQGFTVLTVC